MSPGQAPAGSATCWNQGLREGHEGLPVATTLQGQADRTFRNPHRVIKGLHRHIGETLNDHGASLVQGDGQGAGNPWVSGGPALVLHPDLKARDVDGEFPQLEPDPLPDIRKGIGFGGRTERPDPEGGLAGLEAAPGS